MRSKGCSLRGSGEISSLVCGCAFGGDFPLGSRGAFLPNSGFLQRGRFSTWPLGESVPASVPTQRALRSNGTGSQPGPFFFFRILGSTLGAFHPRDAELGRSVLNNATYCASSFGAEV